MILLDLATDGKTTAHDVTELILGQPEVKHQLRATRFGAPKSPTGCPDNQADWALCTEALIRLADEAKRQAAKVRKSARRSGSGSPATPDCRSSTCSGT